MSASLLGEAAPGFDRPLDVLQACHTQIVRRCDTLERLLAHLQAPAPTPVFSDVADVQARQAARAVLAYFDAAAPHHHDDEERNLFPLLEAAASSRACDLVETLTLEHDDLSLIWRRLRDDLARIEAGQGTTLDAALVKRFVTLNRSHVDFENAHLLPLARRLLGASELERLGRAMAARRGVAYRV